MLVPSLYNHTPPYWMGQVHTSEPTAPWHPSWSRLPPEYLSEFLLVCKYSAVRTRGISAKLVSSAPHTPLNTLEVLTDVTDDY